MYVMKEDRLAGYGTVSHLYEMSAAELAQSIRLALEAGRSTRYYKVEAARAHRHVRAGYIHSTTLWVDDVGRIRKA